MSRNHDNSLTVSLFLGLLLLVTTLTIEAKIGLIVLAAIVLLMTVLLRPDIIFLLMICLFSIEGFSALESVSYPKILGVLLTLGLALRLAMNREAIPKDNAYIYFFFFFAGSIVSFAFSKVLSVSIQIYITYISLFFLYIFTRYFIKNLDDLHRALSYIFISTVLAFAVVQVMGFSIRHNASSRISSGMGDPNEFASYILVLIPLVLYRIMNSSGTLRRILLWGIFFCFILLLGMTGSRGGILGFLGASAILIYHYAMGRLRQIILLLILVATAAFFFIPEELWVRASTVTQTHGEDSSISIRLNNYKAAIAMFVDHPIAGVGLYNFKFNSNDYGIPGQLLVVHNTYLEMLTGGGVLSFTPFLIILIICWRKLRLKTHYDKNMRNLVICLKASFVSILITSYFLSADHKKILWFLLALISSSYYIAARNKNEDPLKQDN